MVPRLRALVAMAALCASSAFGVVDAASAASCEGGSFDSTFDLIQKAVFENRGCTSSFCHDASASGGLDLRAGVAYDNLVSRPVLTVPPGTITGLMRVVPGQKDQSLLYINLAAATLPGQWQAPLRPMPQGGLAPLSINELEAVREWIEGGAPRDGVVRGTGELLDACLPPPKPIEIEPLAPPAPGAGVQVRMPRWDLLPHSEREVCFASYYDVSDQVPPEFLGPDGTTFRYRRTQIRQDPISHHLIVRHYDGAAGLDDPVWGEFLCRGGERDGQPCDPAQLGECGAAAECGSPPKTALACIGFGPADRDLASTPFSGTQEASTETDFPPGVYGELPLRGTLIWNSHAFNLTDESGKLEAWINFEFATPEEQQIPARGIFDTSDIFAMQVPAFGVEEVCNHHVFPPSTQVFQLNSHTHKRGKRFRIFNGAFSCAGGPNDGAACSPLGPDTGLPVPDTCAGAPCQSKVPPAVGDCNGDLDVSIDELVLGVNMALGSAAADCTRFDANGDGAVSIDELVAAVRAALNPQLRDPEQSLLYTSLVYNDPLVLDLDPPMSLGGADSVEAARTLTYCSLYDNGFTNPADVKRQSTSPKTPLGIPGVVGGPCITPTGCTEGRMGQPCSGTTQAARDASCDSGDGAGDGLCDACPLVGGVTTEDEMFILLGAFYVEQ